MNDHVSGEDLAAYVDGLLAADKKNELENHFSRCPACLEELAEIAVIMDGREKIPSRFLQQALGEKSKAARPVLHLRLLFEVAAAFVVVIFIGYLFISGNRFWQTREGQKPLVVTKKNVDPGKQAASFGRREVEPLPAQRLAQAEDGKTKKERDEAKTVQGLAAAAVPKKLENAGAGKSLPAESLKALAVSAPADKMLEMAEEQPQTAAANESLQKNELARTTTAPGAVGGVQMESAVKDQAPAAVMKGKAAAPPSPDFRFEGEAGLNDLRNPELLASWPWFRNGLTLELQINAAGTVVAAVPLGKTDLFLIGQAENEVKKLLFSVSEKKLRRARLIAGASQPN